MVYVYILRSLSSPGKTYIGKTTDLRRRVKDHNSGQTVYTMQFAPWEIISYIAFASKEKAGSFEKYLKRSGGWRFAQRRLI